MINSIKRFRLLYKQGFSWKYIIKNFIEIQTEYHLDCKWFRIWIHPEYSKEWLRLGIQLDKQGSFEINLIWIHAVFMYY